MSPYFNDRQKKKKNFFSRLKIYGFLILFFALVFGGIYFVFYSSFFQIKKINAEFNGLGLERNFSKDLDVFFASVSPSFGFNSILAWESGNVNGDFLSQYPEIKEITVKKNYWKREVDLTAVKREKFGIWCLQNKCFWFDENGIAFEESPSMEGGLIRRADDLSGRLIKKGDMVLESHLAGNMIKIFRVLEDAGLISSLVLEDIELQEITALPARSGFPEIYFSLRINPSFGLTALEKLKEKNLANISYIDLRVENRAYYK